MKRAAALAALMLLLAVSVSARAIFLLPADKQIIQNTSSVGYQYPSIALRGSQYAINLAARINPQGRLGFDVENEGVTVATWAAQGKIKGKTYSSVIWPGERMTHSAAVVSTPCYPCSMTVTAGPVPVVPQLFISGYSGTIESGFAGNVAACSTGVNGECFDPGNEGPGYSGGRTGIHGANKYWMTPVGSAPYPGIWRNALPGVSVDTTVAAWASPSGGDLPDGGYRVVLGQDGSNWINAPFAGTPPAWRDSIYNDPLRMARLMWSQYYKYNYWFPGNNLPYANYMSVNYERHRAGAQPLGFLQWYSPYLIDVGGLSNNDNRLIGDPALLACGLAWFDSLTNHDLFGANPNRIRGAVILSGVCSHGDTLEGQTAAIQRAYSTGNGGFVLADSTGWKRGVDSLFALGVPVTCCVRVDSAAAYASELNYLKAKPNAYFAVERWRGTALSASQARDSLIKLVGRDRVTTLLAGNMRTINGLTELGVLNTQRRDSVACKIRAAGFTAISMNAETDSSASANDSTWWTAQQRFEPAAGGGGLMVLAYPGYNFRGATNGHGRDSCRAVGNISQKTPNDSTFISYYFVRTFYGLMFSEWLPPIDYYRATGAGGTFTTTSTTHPWFGEPDMTASVGRKATRTTGTNLIRITSSSLGTGQWGLASPNMPGYYQIKYTKNAMDTANQLNGRTLFQLVRADQLTYKDIQR